MNSDSVKNYVSLERFSLLYDHFAFIDTPEYYADQLFIRHQVRVWFGHKYAHSDQKYVVILCKVRKRDRDKFLSALGEMNSKMLLCGYHDYEEFCSGFLTKLSGWCQTALEREA